MAKYSNTIEYKLKTTSDLSGVGKLNAELKGLKNTFRDLGDYEFLPQSQVSRAISSINKIGKAMHDAFNPRTGMMDVSVLQKQLNGLNLNNLQKTFNMVGSQGLTAFNKVVGSVAKIDTGSKSISSSADKIFNTLGNTVRWGITASLFETMSNRLYDAVNYVKELDRSLNEIRIVSDYSAEDMRKFSLYANDAAKALGQTTVAYTDASLIFAQQGYSLEDSNKLADLTLKVANTTKQSTAEVSEQLTSWVNGYQLSLEELGTTLDKVTKVAAAGASDTQELMTAASKVASTAATLGVSTDQLISQMSTIISVTREAPKPNLKIAWAA